jgi:hypothetical protein
MTTLTKLTFTGITVTTSHCFTPGDRITIYSLDGVPRKTATVQQVTRTTLHFSATSQWSLFWFYLTHFSTWLYALDIPFTPPDI